MRYFILEKGTELEDRIRIEQWKLMEEVLGGRGW